MSLLDRCHVMSCDMLYVMRCDVMRYALSCDVM